MPLARKANENVYANPDGTYTARIYSGAVNYQAEPGDWRPIDSNVVADAKGGFRNAAGPFNVHFAADSGGASLLEVQNGKNRVGFTAPPGSRAARATTSGSMITLRRHRPQHRPRIPRRLRPGQGAHRPSKSASG